MRYELESFGLYSIREARSLDVTGMYQPQWEFLEELSASFYGRLDMLEARIGREVHDVGLRVTCAALIAMFDIGCAHHLSMYLLMNEEGTSVASAVRVHGLVRSSDVLVSAVVGVGQFRSLVNFHQQFAMELASQGEWEHRDLVLVSGPGVMEFLRRVELRPMRV